MTVTVTQAQVTTLQISVQAIRIGPKQMTQAVFRQLKRDDEVRGPMWGQVNYHPDCSGTDHLHVVWQLGDELRHARVWDPDSWVPFANREGKGAELLARVMRAKILGGWRPEEVDQGKVILRYGDRPFRVPLYMPLDNSAARLVESEHRLSLRRERVAEETESGNEKWREDAKLRVLAAEEDVAYDLDALRMEVGDDRLDELEAVIEDHVTTRRRWWSEACALPQLFIAV